MPCRPTIRRWPHSASSSPSSGSDRSGDAVRKTARLGSRWRSWPKIGSQNRIPFIHGLEYASPSPTQGGSRMRESRTYGSVRGALRNERPYRDRLVSMNDAEILGDQLFIVHNVAGVAGEHAASGVEDDRLIRNVERQLDILFDENDGLPFLFQSSDGAADFGDDQRRKAFRRLIEQKHPRIAHQRAPDRKHLLFAAGERAGILCVAFTQPRKQGVNPVDVPRCAGCTFALLRHNKVFTDRKR